MNTEFDQVRAVRVTSADLDTVVGRSWTRLMEDLATAKPHRSHAVRGWAIGGGIGLVAAATATAVVLTGQPGTVPNLAITQSPVPAATTQPTPSSTPSAPPTVQTVLASAARSVANSDATDGAYRKVNMTVTTLSTYFDRNGELDEYGIGSGNGPVVGILVQRQREVYIPAERTEQWPERYVGQRKQLQLWGDQSYDLTNYGSENGYAGWRNTWDLQSLIGPMDSMPTDAEGVYDTVLAATGGDAEQTGWYILHGLESNALPYNVQSAFFGAAQLLPHATLVSSEGTRAVIDWRGSSEEGKRMKLTIDTSTGRVVTSEWWYGRDDTQDLNIDSEIPDVRYDLSVSSIENLPEGLG